MKKIILLSFALFSMNLVLKAQGTAKDAMLTNVFSFCWMPDGKAVCFTVIRLDKTMKLPPTFAIFKIDLKTNQTELIVKNGHSPSISPDGKFLAYTKLSPTGLRGGNTDIHIYNLKDKTQKIAVNDTLRESSPSWSPDGKKLVYTIETNTNLGANLANLNLWVVNLSTGEKTQITQTIKSDKAYNPIWSPKGDNIVYFLEKGDKRDQIYLTNESGSFHTNVTNDTTTHNYYPTWFGEKIMYTNAPDNMALIGKDGKEKSFIAGIKISRAAYNPKSDQILFLSPGTMANPSKLMVFDMKSKKSVPVISKEVLDNLIF